MNKEKFLTYSLFIMWFVHLHSFTLDVSFTKTVDKTLLRNKLCQISLFIDLGFNLCVLSFYFLLFRIGTKTKKVVTSYHAVTVI